MKPIIEKIEVRDRNGKVAILNYNEPRPDLDVKTIESQLVDLRSGELGLTSLRIRIEKMLDHSCGERNLERIKDMGDQVASILIKIIGRGKNCSGCSDRRAKAVFSLGYFSNAGPVSCLTGLAKNKSESINIRIKAINALGYIGSDSSIETIEKIATRERSDTILRSIVYALGTSRSIKAIPVLERMINKSRSPLVKRQIYASINHLEKFHGLPVFHNRPGLENIKVSYPKKLNKLNQKFTNGTSNTL